MAARKSRLSRSRIYIRGEKGLLPPKQTRGSMSGAGSGPAGTAGQHQDALMAFLAALFNLKPPGRAAPDAPAGHGCPVGCSGSCRGCWDLAANMGDGTGSRERVGRIPPGSLPSFTSSPSRQAPSCAAGRETGSSSTWTAAWFTTTTRRSVTWMAGSTSNTAAGM